MNEKQTISGSELLKRPGAGRVSPVMEKTLVSRRFLPIAEADRLYLDVLDQGNDARFAARFRIAWAQIPHKDRSRIQSYWSAYERIPQVLGVPIALVFDDNSPRTGGMVGPCDPPNDSLIFFAPVVDRMPVDVVDALIGHVLAHVLQARDRDQPDAWRPGWVDERVHDENDGTMPRMLNTLVRAADPDEYQADRIALRWGFDTLGMNRWLLKNLRDVDLPEGVA